MLTQSPRKPINAEPHFITRKDREVGRWSAEACAPKRGEARTNIIDRHIYVPVGDTPLEKVIRAHELMHAKITPAEEFEQWVNRKIASVDSLRAVEELRVNYGIECAGFNLDDLTDGREDADGEYVAIHNEWASAVRFAVATAGTAGGKRFLTGVRRHNKQWADALQKIQKHLYKQVTAAHTGKNGRKHVFKEDIFSTEVHRTIGLAPHGFAWTERWAEYVDRLGAMPPKEKKAEAVNPVAKDGESKDSDQDDDSDDKSTSNIVGVGLTTKQNTPDEPYEEILRKTQPLKQSQGNEKWGNLIWGKVPLSIVGKGTLGRTKIPTNIGKNPRRIHRMYVDPHRRVFDSMRKAQGGVVLIDGSGSMCLSRKDVLDILKVAPGATVAIYSDMDNCSGKIPNIHILAKDGKCVEERNMPQFGCGNGVDLPALEWAIDQRKGRKTPVVWVTDGGVCAPHGGHSDALIMSCINMARRNNVVCVEGTKQAVEAIKSLASGRTVKRRWPAYFASYLQRLNGYSLTQEVSA
jgi:hypothetical protein